MTKHTVSDASVKRYWEIRGTDKYKYHSWPAFEAWAKAEGVSKGGAFWDAMRRICGEDKAFLGEAIFSFQLAQEKLDTITNAFAIINELNDQGDE